MNNEKKTSSLEELKKDINNIMLKNKPSVILNSKIDRKIREIEKAILEIKPTLVFEVNLEDLEPNQKDKVLGSQNFKRKDYKISWEDKKDGSGPRLYLTNIAYKNSKILIKTPNEYKNSLEDDLAKFYNLYIDRVKKA